MDFLKLDKGLIITYNQSDVILHQGKRIEVIPAYSFLSAE